MQSNAGKNDEIIKRHIENILSKKHCWEYNGEDFGKPGEVFIESLTYNSKGEPVVEAILSYDNNRGSAWQTVWTVTMHSATEYTAIEDEYAREEFSYL